MPVEIGLIRIDDRLMHGQVAVGWTKVIHPDHIIIANDIATHDPVQRTLLEMASPPQYGVTICEAGKVADICAQPALNNKRLIILFASVHDVVQAVDHGMEVKAVNVGGLRYSSGKTQIRKAVAIDTEDIGDFKKLLAKGIEVNIQMVPTDEPVPIGQYIKE